MSTTYRTVQGDTWDGIAFRIYGDAGYMTALMNANLEHAETAVFTGNVQLVVPEKPIDAADTLPPWRREE